MAAISSICVFRPENLGIYASSIDTKPEGKSSEAGAAHRPAGHVHISSRRRSGTFLFLRDSTLFAQPFDPSRLELSAEPVPVADQVGSFAAANAGLFSASESGVLAYRVGTGGDQRQLTWFDPQGKVLGTVGDKGPYTNPTISPDGTRIAIAQLDQQGGNSNIWCWTSRARRAGLKVHLAMTGTTGSSSVPYR